ncbi:hypothetical protein CRM22_005042 [Opisthorchis felineus]|uniref:PHD-type domain-containing protein n=2 Tax=Opisthorchis felineus TaxID=147828 RepID=A0A4V3SF40_OPIFE|nr:hypothetical protein CRM22_005042 [Opisthorchis felineus]
MLEPETEKFLCCYAEMLQVMPMQMQAEISSYLQSDLQHQHLLRLCEKYMEELKRSHASEQNLLARKLVYCLAAIQDICDRRLSMVDELHNLLEKKTQQLLTLQPKAHADTPKSCASGGENNDESELDTELDIDKTEDPDDASRACQSEVRQKDTVQENNKTESRGVTTLRSKARLHLRSGPQLGRSSGIRAPLGRWENGHQRRAVNNKSHKPSLNSMKERMKERAGDRMNTEQRYHKLPGPYPLYSRVQQQQRLKKQQRAISRALQANRNRSIHYTDPSSRRNHLSPGETGPHYLATGRRLESKLSRFTGNARSSGRNDWSGLQAEYFDPETDPNTRSASNVSSDNENDETEGGVQSRRNSGTRMVDPNFASCWTKDSVVSSEELDSEHTDENDPEGASLPMREIKPYYSKDQRSRMASPAASNVTIRKRFCETGRRRLTQLRKSDEIPASYDQTRTERITAQSSIPLNSPSTGIHRNLVSRSLYSHGNGILSKRRDLHMPRCRQDPKAVRPSPDPNTRYVPPTDSVGASKRRSSLPNRSPSGNTSDESTDERLYCLCKKVSFGDMIACDNKHCEVEWFHFACVDIRVQPKGKWYCPLCRGDSSKLKRSAV